MGKLRDLDIRYVNVPVFAGQFLRGYVCFNLNEKTKVRDLGLWVEGQTKVTLPGDITDEKWLLRTEINLGTYLSQYDYKLPAGFHQVPFAFNISSVLPSSFGEKYGYIYYCCRVTVSGRSKVHKPFTVMGIEDLNWHPYAAMPVNVRERAVAPFWSLFNKSAYNVSVVLQLERSGFVPGEAIIINAEIINQSNRKVKQSTMELKQGILYKTPNSRQREFTKVVESIKHDGIPPGSVDQWENEELIIPAIPPSFMRGSEFVSVKYELVFTVDPSIVLTVPIIIGTIPFHPQTLNRNVMKALPWKQPTTMNQFHYQQINADPLKMKTKVFIEDNEPIYVKSNMGNEPIYVKSNAGKFRDTEERRVLKIEEID